MSDGVPNEPCDPSKLNFALDQISQTITTAKKKQAHQHNNTPNGSFSPALATLLGIEDASFFTTSCFGMQTLPTGHRKHNIIV